MEYQERQAEYIDNRQPMVDPRTMSPGYTQQMLQGNQEYEENDMFSKPNDLRVIQEYNNEENLPSEAKSSFWALASKSIKLGFWKEQDIQEIFIHNNIIKVGHIMSKPRHKYTFKERQMMNQMDFLVYSDFKRGVGMERYKTNERTLQATSVQQHIQGGGSMGGKKGGVFSAMKSFFG